MWRGDKIRLADSDGHLSAGCGSPPPGGAIDFVQTWAPPPQVWESEWINVYMLGALEKGSP